MAAAILPTMIVLLLLGFPMMIPLIIGSLVGFFALFGGFGQLETMVQQILAGIRPASLIAVPMFIFAADIMTRGQSADRLIDMVMAFVGHVQGRPRRLHRRRLHHVRRRLRLDPGDRGRGRRRRCGRGC